MRVVAASSFKYNGRDVRPRDLVEMSQLEFDEFRKFGMVRLPIPGTAEDAPVMPRGLYRRRDMRADG